jgi:hypothetical protein
VQVGEEGQWHPLDVLVERAAESGDDPLADGGHEVRLPVPTRPLDHIGPEQEQGNEAQHRPVVADEDLVHGWLDQPRDGALRAGHH